MDYLPLFARVARQSCLVIGGGDIAARKISLLCRAGAAVTVIAPKTAPATRELIAEHELEVYERAMKRPTWTVVRWWSAPLTTRPSIARSSNTAAPGPVDQQRRSAALSNVIFPALVDRSPVIVAVSTGGSSPTLARIVRSWIEARLPARLGSLAEFIRARRDAVKARLGRYPERQRVLGTDHQRLGRGTDLSRRRSWSEQAFRNEQPSRSGFVALVGAGPGDPELLTLKALRLLQSADVVLYDNLVNRDILDYVRRDAELTYVGKKWRAASTRQETFIELMLEHARERTQRGASERRGSVHLRPRWRRAGRH